MRASGNGSEKSGHFLPTFSDGFFSLSKIFAQKSQNGQKKWANGQKYFEFGQAKTVAAQGFEGFLANWSIIFYTIMRKIVKILYKWKIKVGFWPGNNFRKNFGKQKFPRPIQLPLSFSFATCYTEDATHIVRSFLEKTGGLTLLYRFHSLLRKLDMGKSDSPLYSNLT